MNNLSQSAVELAHLWHQVNKGVHELIRHTNKHCHLPSLSWLLLRHIRREPGVTVSQLARNVGTVKSHVSNIVDQLVQDGLVDKKIDEADRRLVRLYTTPRSDQSVHQLIQQAASSWEQVTQYLSPDERQDVVRTLRTLQAALEKTNASMGALDT